MENNNEIPNDFVGFMQAIENLKVGTTLKIKSNSGRIDVIKKIDKDEWVYLDSQWAFIRNIGQKFNQITYDGNCLSFGNKDENLHSYSKEFDSVKEISYIDIPFFRGFRKFLRLFES